MAPGATEESWHYGAVLAVHGGEGEDQEVTIEWDEDGGSQRILVWQLGDMEWLREDGALDLLADIEGSRREELETATAGGYDVVALPLKQIESEMEAFRWMAAEVAARREEAQKLEEENRKLRLERERCREAFEEMLNDNERVHGDSSD